MTIISDRYKLDKKLSSKASRTTYLARDMETDSSVVVKVLEFNELFSWDNLKLFEREAKTLQNINHPQIPDYLDFIELNEEFRGFALVQSYIDAPSLEELIQQGIKFSEKEIIELARKLLEILNYLHGLKPPVIHRDIKPSNILINNRSGNSIGDVYLVDFGSVQTIAKKEAGTITIVGTYGYIPLEQFMGQTTFASDLYSLGMTLIYLVTGTHPGDLAQEKGKVRFSGDGISYGFKRWLSKITEPYADKRYSSASKALKALYAQKNSPNLANLSQDSKVDIYRESASKLVITYGVPKLATSSLLALFVQLFNNSCLLFSWLFFLFSILWISVSLVYTISSIAVVIFAIFSLDISAIASILYLLFFSTNLLMSFVVLKKAIPISKRVHRSLPKKRKIIFKRLSILWDTKDNNIKVTTEDCIIKDKPSNSNELATVHRNSIRTKNTRFKSLGKKELVVYQPRYRFDDFVNKKGIKILNSAVEIPPKLSIVGSDRKIDIKDPQLSEAELWFIANEVSDFLDLDVQMVAQTPVFNSSAFRKTR